MNDDEIHDQDSSSGPAAANSSKNEGTIETISGEEFLRNLFTGKQREKRFEFLEGYARSTRLLQEQHAQRLIEAHQHGDIDLIEIERKWSEGTGQSEYQQSLANALRGLKLPEIRGGCFKIEWIDESERRGLQVTQTCFIPWTNIWFEQHASERAETPE